MLHLNNVCCTFHKSEQLVYWAGLHLYLVFGNNRYKCSDKEIKDMRICTKDIYMNKYICIYLYLYLFIYLYLLVYLLHLYIYIYHIIGCTRAKRCTSYYKEVHIYM